MFKTIQGWWRREEGCRQLPEVTLAVTWLMVGMMSIDGHLDENERQNIIDMVSEQFGISADESAEMIDQAMDTELGIDLVVKKITESFNIEDRAAVLAKLWRVAIADGNIDFLEEQYINRMAALIGVPGRNLAELKAREEKRFPDLKHSGRFTGNETPSS
ncbi:MAG: TerB family tellurite resistance protein [Mariprofundus sp.]|nr:TerB family tellurite resistance protein [Mariprofundus sp.]